MKKTICIYSDESGVFDRNHETYFVFGGIVLNATEDEVSKTASFYKSLENTLRKKSEYNGISELKASMLTPHDKRWLYGKLKPIYKFGIVIELKKLNDNIFLSKKSKQRYQDFAYKIGVKNTLRFLIEEKTLLFDDSIRFEFFVDEHHMATDGRYELREALLQELKEGTFNRNFKHFYQPMFPNTEKLNLHLSDSKLSPLVRAADIVANRIYYECNYGNIYDLFDKKTSIKMMP